MGYSGPLRLVVMTNHHPSSSVEKFIPLSCHHRLIAALPVSLTSIAGPPYIHSKLGNFPNSASAVTHGDMRGGPVNQPTPGTPSLLRAINDRAALQALLERGPLTRPEIGALTGLSKPTASQFLIPPAGGGPRRARRHPRGDCPAGPRRSTSSTPPPRTSPRWTSPPRASTSGSPTSPAPWSASTGCPPRAAPARRGAGEGPRRPGGRRRPPGLLGARSSACRAR